MKKIIYILIIILISACDSENALDCFKKEGAIIQTDVTVAPFTKILFFEGVKLFVKEGIEQKVSIETGENLINDIEIKVEDDKLIIVDNAGCNFIRDYGITKVYVTSPNIVEIRNSSNFAVESIGILSFPKLVLLSEEQIEGVEYYTDGDFTLDLEVEELTITANGFSNFYLNGTAEKAVIGLYSGDSRVEASNLFINDLIISHRSTNKMIVNPQKSIRGVIRGYGNVISKHRPPIVDVQELYTGRLIFDD